jgi:hypothetical protein
VGFSEKARTFAKIDDFPSDGCANILDSLGAAGIDIPAQRCDA